MLKRPLTVAIVGAGHRSVGYARYALSHPERLRVVAVAEPNDIRREAVAREHQIPAAMQFRSYADLANRPPVADAVINGTMDQLHYDSALPLLENGYHMLLEKPIARTEREVRSLIETARRQERTVMICHVLRYAPFYAKVKELLESGAIGEIIALHSSENVSYHHMAVAYIRGRWNSRERSNPMLLAKCCHDLDLIAWYLSGVPAVRVASFGSLKQFRPENAPAGSAARCLDGCRIEASCPYSARANYVTQNLWGFYAWEPIEHLQNPTVEQKLESLRTDNPFGRCVWHCDNDVVDHQTVIVEFANGVTASHNMFGATARPTRTVHLVGSKGEIEGDMIAGRIILRRPNPVAGGEYTEETVALDVRGDGHGGGDAHLIADFVSLLRGEQASRGVTRIEDSLTGHLIAFAADQAMCEQRTVTIEP
ncbi:MAG TPA: Gfo/Idh/MocA family oxidoreductase [Armatimonadota bacterium]|nr:Gfo/Idh/MocA family oxidoreductase [Armatimonadota bacterium]